MLVADAGLGTINAVRLASTRSPRHHVVVYLNRYDPADDLHCRNRDWLVTREGLEVVTDPEALADLLLGVALAVDEVRRRDARGLAVELLQVADRS